MTENKNGQNGQQNAPQGETAPKQEMTKSEASHSERFTNMVMREFSANNGGQINLTPFQKKLCQNYFIKIDMVLKEAEAKRQRKKNHDPLQYIWANVNMDKLATDVVIFSSVGMDPTQPNHVNPIPHKNSATNKYDITFMPGYRGLELKARKYGLDVPDEVVVELVYKNDKFKGFKKDKNNEVETYEFEMADNFDRGELVGGFYYHSFFSEARKNKLKTFSKADIEKRKPDNASAEFWGGEKNIWENGKVVGKEMVEGWYDEMAHKTIYRAAYNAITIDSEKIDANYLQLILKESESKDLRIADEIQEKGNKTEMAFEDADVVDVNEKDEVSVDLTNVPDQKEIIVTPTNGRPF